MTATISGASAIAISLVVPGNGFVIMASLFGATAGFVLKRYAKRKSGLYA